MPALLSIGLHAVVVSGSEAKPPVVMAADGILCDLTRTLSGGATDVRCLIPPGSDPHHLQLSPAKRNALAQARLVLINGYNLTPQLTRFRSSSQAVMVGERAVPHNPSGDPHLWHNPVHTQAMAAVVTKALSQMPMRSASKQALQRRLRLVTAVLKDLDNWNRRQIATIPAGQRVVVSEHRAFASFARRYGLRYLALLDEHASGGALRPSGLNAMTAAVRSSQTRVLFAEHLPASRTLNRISGSSGKPIANRALMADGTTPGRNLIETATTNTCTIVIAQGGRCDQSGARQLAQRWAAVQ